LTIGLIVAAVLPLAIFGIVVIAAGWESNEQAVTSLFALAIAGPASSVARGRPARGQPDGAAAPYHHRVERVAAGESSPPIHLTGDDELARLAESHNRIAADAQRRNAELAALLTAIAAYAPSQGVAPLVAQAERDAARSTA